MICFICGKDDAILALQIKRDGKKWDIYSCGYCLTQFLHPIPSNAELQGLYDEFYEDGVGQTEWLSNPNYGRLSFPRQWGIIKKLTEKKYGRILDFGCGGGHFLARVSDRWDKYGVDISETARDVAYRKGIKVFESIDVMKHYWGEFFDVIVMFATIEHLPNPREVVSELTGLLKVGGLFAIATGDVASIKAKLQGESWHLYEPPGHIYYFTAHSLDYLMESLGFRKIKHLYTDGGATQIPFMPLNLALRAGLEVYQRIPLLNKLPLFDAYYGYYRKVEAI